MNGRGLLVSIALALVILMASPVPLFAQGPSLADIESEIDTVQWGVVYCAIESGAGYLEALKLLIVLEIADKFVESAMAEYAHTGELTDEAGHFLNCAINLLERAQGITEGEGCDLSANINKAVDMEKWREEKLSECGGLREGDIPWTGDSMEVYDSCTTVDSYIDVMIARISLWTPD